MWIIGRSGTSRRQLGAALLFCLASAGSAAIAPPGSGKTSQATSSGPQWGAPEVLLGGLGSDSYPYFYRFAPVFGSDGTAYVYEIIVHNGQRELVWSHSSGPDSAWTAPSVAVSDPDSLAPDTGVTDAAVVSDHLGNLVLVMSTFEPYGPTQLRAWHYAAASGWSGPELIASGLTQDCHFAAAADNKGNVVVSCRGESAPTYVYSSAQKAWQSASPVLTSTGFYLLKSFQLVSNPSGSGVYAVYGEGVNLGYGPLYVRRFDSARLDWQNKRRVLAANGDSNTVAAAVDDAGTLSLLYFGNYTERTIKASRYQSGFWTWPATVLDVTGSPNPIFLGAASVNAAGEVLAPMIAVNSSVTSQAYAEHWNGSQWNTEVVAGAIAPGYIAPNFRASAAWVGSGSAAAMLFDFGGSALPSYQGILTAYNDGSGGWSSTVNLPGVTQSISTFGVFAGPDGKVLSLDYDPYQLNPVDLYAIGASWLTN